MAAGQRVHLMEVLEAAVRGAAAGAAKQVVSHRVVAAAIGAAVGSVCPEVLAGNELSGRPKDEREEEEGMRTLFARAVLPVEAVAWASRGVQRRARPQEVEREGVQMEHGTSAGSAGGDAE